MVQYYTLEQAAQLLRVSPDQLKEMARKKEVRAFQDRSGWRFRAQEIDELARSRGLGSDPELPLSDGGKGKTGIAGGQDVFNFSLDADEGDEVSLGKQPSSATKGPSPSGSGSRSTKSPPPKASSDSDVRLVMEGSDLDFSIEAEGSKTHGSKAPVSPAPKVGSSKSRKAPPAKEDSGVRIVPLDQPSDSDVKIAPSSGREGDVPLGESPAKRPSDSDIRIEEMPRTGSRDQMVTEEIDVDAEQRKAEAARAKAPRQRPKPGSSPILPTTSPFELSENDMNVDLPAAGPRSPEKTKGETDSSSDFELKPLTDSSPIELSSDELKAMQSDEEVSLGELTGAKGGSGINLQDPADSGISLEPESSEFELTVESGTTPKPAPASDPGTDSSSDFELSLHEDDSSPAEGSSSEFELSLQGDEGLAPGSSSEFELSLDSAGAEEEGSSDLALEAPGTDSDSEFELTLDESGGLSVEEGGEGSSDFEVPALEEEGGGEESDTDLESSEFDLSLEGEESGSQVVPLEDEEEYDEGAATVQRPAPKLKPAAKGEAEGEEDLGEALDEDLDAEPAVEEAEEPAAVTAAAPPAEWGVVAPIASLLCTIILFVVGLMSFELIQGMWGYHRGTKVSNFLIHPLAKTLSGEDNLPDN